MTTYTDPRFNPLYSEHDEAWENPTGIVNGVLGKRHPRGCATVIDDPDVDGIVVHPEHDFQDLSSPIVLARSIDPRKFEFLLGCGGERVYLFDDMSLRVHQVFFVTYGFLLVGVLEKE
ncbi:hypothetical protein D0962_09490 [Leptolyngbyaceae cyanobacterium CCMR0082]|uniref:Uncharacterized protein n=1 Tax=Adonisia turfae CCMR0082 TaxID=2304604 RepID=A0A6M0S4Y1_9CYAN|nr:hypothetical protein [Adonisia turfae]NEZ63011.1 hypothetical protein [Adonisia turfae CCMR0082]